MGDLTLNDLRPGDVFVFRGDDQRHIKADRIIECMSDDGQAVVYARKDAPVTFIGRLSDYLPKPEQV